MEKQEMSDNGDSKRVRIIVILFLLAFVSAAILVLVWATTDSPPI